MLLLILTSLLLWRLLRPLNIFVMEDKFAYGIPVTIPEGLDSISAKSCGVCHEEIYKEWSQSIHAQAWSDPYYQQDMEFEGRPYICINCHIPLQPQREKLILGYRDSDKLDPILKKNPDFNPQLQDEGVTCAVCHLRDGVIIGSFQSNTAPHPIKVDREFLTGMSPCNICHVVSGDRWDMFYSRPPCGTLSEIFEVDRPIDCVGCHMPATTRPIALNGEPRTSGKHLFLGGHSQKKVKSALTVEHQWQEHDNLGTFILSLTNTGTNHFLPTGTPDRHLTVEIKLLDRQNQIIKQEQHKLIRTILWRPVIIDLWDSRLPYGKPRLFKVDFNKNSNNRPVAIAVTVRYHLLEESRRKRIGYKPETPIDYPIFQKKFLVP